MLVLSCFPSLKLVSACPFYLPAPHARWVLLRNNLLGRRSYWSKDSYVSSGSFTPVGLDCLQDALLDHRLGGIISYSDLLRTKPRQSNKAVLIRKYFKLFFKKLLH